ncbi:hypothetical protein [[Phormidium] sp. ETS-05]|uniref:hypothetical protein n=1 Tax=[Phormidium] sp. ETS-05 TaxID=222819 RepID=UPI001E64E443|nr:hypothetical protein [[Phormidium] sp. ETS-05]
MNSQPNYAMSDSILVNLQASFLNAAGFWESNLSEKPGNWCKLVQGIDKTQTDGYSIIGDFVSQIAQTAYQQPGLYLHCQKKGSNKAQQKRIYTLFALQPNGEIEVITESKNASKDWAVELWPEIEAYMAKQNNYSTKRRQEIQQRIETIEFELRQLRVELAALDFNDQLSEN